MPATEANCPHCARPISSGAAKGLCPACLAASLSELLGEAEARETEPMPSLAAPHERVGGYELLDELGRGGMGVVFRARDFRLNRIVALKLILAGNLASEAEVKRFRNEAESVAQLEHPHIVPIYEVGESGGRHFFAMKLVEGGSLTGRISNLQSRSSNPQAAELLAKVAHAVHHAHQRGILHRDLKPANILLDADGEPMVSDFGLARRVEGASELTLSGAVLGSPSYMAPEQAAGGGRAVTTAADIYSLGAILYELLCGQPPFVAATLLETLRRVVEEEPVAPWVVRRQRVNPKSEIRNPKEGRNPKSELASPAASLRDSDFGFRPSDLDIICLKCLAKEPARRYATAEALAEDLEHWLRHEPILARPSGPWERTAKWVRRRPALAALISVTGVGLATLLGVLVMSNARIEQALEQARRNAQRATNETARATTNALHALAEARRAESNALTARQNSYAADIYQAAQLVEAGRLGTALDLLKNHEPAPGQPDVRGFEWRWLRSQCVGDPARVLEGTSGPIHTLAFSADGRRMASGGRETIRLWDTDNWQPGASFPDTSQRAELENRIQHGLDLMKRDPKNLEASLDLLLGRTSFGGKNSAPSRPDQADANLALAWSPDGRTLATAGTKAFVKFWDVASGRMRTWNEPGSEHVVFLPDGRAVALGEGTPGYSKGGRNLQCVDSATGKAVETLASNITSFAVSANGRWLATIADRNEVAVLATSNLLEVARFQSADAWLGPLAVSSDGRRVAGTTWLSTHAQVYDLSKVSRPADSGTLNSQVIALSFSPDDRRVAFGMRDSTVRLHDAASGKALRRFSGHLGEVFAVGWGPGGELISAGQDGAIRLWDQAAPPRAASISNRMFGCVVAPGGDQFAGQTLEGRTILWDGRTPETRAVNDRPGFFPLAFRPEEAALLVAATPGYAGRTLEVWRLADGATLRALPLAFDVRILASPRGDRVVVWSATEAVVYDMARGVELTRWRAERQPFRNDQQWNNDEGVFTGELLLACTAAHGAALWDVATGRCLFILQPPDGVETGSVAMTPDGTRLLTGDNDHRIRVWDARDGRLLRTLAGHGGTVELMAVSPDGRTLASYAQDRRVKLWSLPTGRELMTMPSADDLGRVLFTPDGLGLAVGLAWSGATVWRGDVVK